MTEDGRRDSLRLTDDRGRMTGTWNIRSPVSGLFLRSSVFRARAALEEGRGGAAPDRGRDSLRLTDDRGRKTGRGYARRGTGDGRRELGIFGLRSSVSGLQDGTDLSNTALLIFKRGYSGMDEYPSITSQL